MATFFIMRELEVAAALASHIQIDNEISKVTLRLPISKTDSRAAGCSRSWAAFAHLLADEWTVLSTRRRTSCSC
jgi:hypothetical protein